MAIELNGTTKIIYDNLNSNVTTLMQPKNWIINGGFDVWQRGTSFVASTIGTGKKYIADRWSTYYYTLDSHYHSRITGEFGNYAMKFGRADGETNTTASWLVQDFETLNSKHFASKTLTLSFYAKKGSGLSNGLTVRIYAGNGIDENWANGYTSGVIVSEILISKDTQLTTSLQKFSSTFSIPSGKTQLAIQFLVYHTGTALNDYIIMENIKLEYGLIATEYISEAYADVLRQCQRYYEVYRLTMFSRDSSGATVLDSWLVQKRSIPTLTLVSGRLELLGQPAIYPVGFGFGDVTTKYVGYIYANGGSWLASQVYYGYITIDAEL